MQDKDLKDFQETVDKYLIRHRSILDVMTKYQEASARVNRALAKAVTECGCVSVAAAHQQVPEDIAYSEIRQYMQSHLHGTLCPHCQEIIAKELGHALFYSAALCSLTGLSLETVMQRENKAVSTLGYYYLS